MNYDPKLVTALRATASQDPDTRARAQRAFAQALSEPLRQGVMDEDSLGDIYEREVLQAGAQAHYPLDIIKPGEEDNFVAFTYQNQNRIPERRVEADELWVPTYKIANAMDWDVDIARDARFDLIARALEVYRMGYTRKLNYDGWTTILAAAAQRGLAIGSAAGAALPFTGHVIQGSHTLGGEFTKELVSRMIIGMIRGAGGNAVRTNMTDLYCSVEAVADMRAWNASDVDDFTRRELITQGRDQHGLANLYGVVLHPMQEFGVGQDYQSILTDLGASLPSGTNQFCVGLDLSTTDSFVMPIRQELTTFEDPTLQRQLRAGVYGYMEQGFAVLDLRRVILGAH
jgi:hypothetical protein